MVKFSKNLSNKNMLKVEKFGVSSINCFWAWKFSEQRVKMTPRFNRAKQSNQSDHFWFFIYIIISILS